MFKTVACRSPVNSVIVYIVKWSVVKYPVTGRRFKRLVNNNQALVFQLRYLFCELYKHNHVISLSLLCGFERRDIQVGYFVTWENGSAKLERKKHEEPPTSFKH